jgi:hypothetical protein
MAMHTYVARGPPRKAERAPAPPPQNKHTHARARARRTALTL